jgi:hypothetical protein
VTSQKTSLGWAADDIWVFPPNAFIPHPQVDYS